MNRDDISYWTRTGVYSRHSKLTAALAVLKDLADPAGLQQDEVLAVLYVLRDHADWRQFSEQEQSCLLSAITEMEPEEEPELPAFKTIEPATLDARIAS